MLSEELLSGEESAVSTAHDLADSKGRGSIAYTPKWALAFDTPHEHDSRTQSRTVPMPRITSPRQWWREHLQNSLDVMFERIDEDLADRTDVARFVSDDHADVTTSQPPAPLRPRVATNDSAHVDRSA
jgi:hypothetical protein